ncbi:DUF6633 family protein [Bacteroides graminisolvens]|uniref:DUF6633 family protein n=1 Tax=Bacteroides graminisolvens TaxID=477666 RepID=UPI0029C8B207|nr:DUF6633 family protein [Bacteroides graminisolvens]
MGNLVKLTRQETSLQTLQTTQKKAQITCLTTKYSTFCELGKAFNPQVGARLPNNTERVYTSDAPTIQLVSEAYGRTNALSWISIQLNSIDLFTQVKNDLNEDARKELAELILSHYGFLKLPEFMLFVARFKLGIYGRFYGSFDPIAFCEAIKRFRSDRNIELERLRLNRLRDEIEARNSPIPDGYTSWSWYMELKRRATEGDTDAIEQLFPSKQGKI